MRSRDSLQVVAFDEPTVIAGFGGATDLFCDSCTSANGDDDGDVGVGEKLTQAGKFAAVMVSAELGSPFSEETELAILSSWRQATRESRSSTQRRLAAILSHLF